MPWMDHHLCGARSKKHGVQRGERIREVGKFIDEAWVNDESFKLGKWEGIEEIHLQTSWQGLPCLRLVKTSWRGERNGSLSRFLGNLGSLTLTLLFCFFSVKFQLDDVCMTIILDIWISLVHVESLTWPPLSNANDDVTHMSSTAQEEPKLWILHKREERPTRAIFATHVIGSVGWEYIFGAWRKQEINFPLQPLEIFGL